MKLAIYLNGHKINLADYVLMNLGEEWEKQCSLQWHIRFTPVLVSPGLLKRYNCGQVDVSYWDKEKLTLVEAKQGPWISDRQLRRLKNSAEFLGQIFDCNVVLRIEWNQGFEELN